MVDSDTRVYDIPASELSGVEDKLFEMLHMDRETVMEDFDDVFEATGERRLASLACKGIFTVLPIIAKDNDAVRVESGHSFASAVLADAMGLADELVLYAVTVHGYEELARDPSNSPFDTMFFDGWAVGSALSSHRWIKKAIAEYASERGLFAGRGWVPGDGDLELELQQDLLGELDVSRVGITLSESGSVRPAMTLCGFMGLSADAGIVDVGASIAEVH